MSREIKGKPRRPEPLSLPAGEVRNRDHQQAARSQHAMHAVQFGGRVGNVLKRMAHDHDIERFIVVSD